MKKQRKLSKALKIVLAAMGYSKGVIPDGAKPDTYFARLNSGEAVIPLDELWKRLNQ